MIVMFEGEDYYVKSMCILCDLDDIDVLFSFVCGWLCGLLCIDVGGLIVCDVFILLLLEFVLCYFEIRIDFGVLDCLVDLIVDNVDCVICGGLLDSVFLVVCYLGDVLLIMCVMFGYFK